MLKRFGLVRTKAKSISVGDKFGRLTVVAFGQVPDTYIYKAVCRCDCGSPLKVIRFDGLVSGVVVGCGCVRKERTTTHGLTQSDHYGRWRHMLDRCNNPSCVAYPDYGGRGIKVCPEWHDLKTFIAQLPDGFFKGAEIDRIDNDGWYEPNNVRWVSRKKNTGNRRSGRFIELNGKKQSITDWASETGISHATIATRLDDLGWSVSRALTTPAMTAKERMARAHEVRWSRHIYKPKPKPFVVRKFMFRGEMATIKVISSATGIPEKLLRKRICERGWSVERATES